MGFQPTDEDQFKRVIYTKHQTYFDPVYSLFMFAQEALRNYRGLATDEYFASLQLIFPRAFKSFDSVRRLCEIASCEDAAVVLRSLLNLAAVTRWISLDPIKRGKRYLGWYWIQMYRISEQFKDTFPKAWISETHKRYAAEKSQFEYQNGKMVKHWYQPEANTIRDLFKQVELEQHYVEAYEPLSGVKRNPTTVTTLRSKSTFHSSARQAAPQLRWRLQMIRRLQKCSFRKPIFDSGTRGIM